MKLVADEIFSLEPTHTPLTSYSVDRLVQAQLVLVIDAEVNADMQILGFLDENKSLR